MKIDHEYLKGLLEACQASHKPTFDIEDLKAAGFDYNDVNFEFHMSILDDKGFIRQDSGDPGYGLIKSMGGFKSWSVIPLRITAQGHEFIDAVQNPEVWSMTKAAVKKIGDVSFDLFLQIAKQQAKEFAIKKLGMPL